MDFAQQYTQNMDAHVQALGQKYMGIRPTVHEQMFQSSPVNDLGRHDVLVDNFLNAQCKVVCQPCHCKQY